MKGFFKRYSIFTNVALIVLMSISFTLLMSLIYFNSIKDLAEDIKPAYYLKLNTNITIKEIEDNLRYISYYMPRLPDTNNSEEIRHNILRLDNEVRNRIAAVENKEINKKALDLLGRFKDSYNNYLGACEDKIKAGKTWTEADEDQLDSRKEQAFSAIAALADYNGKRESELKAKSRNIYNASIPALVVVILVSCGFLFIFSMYLISSIRNSVKEVFTVLSRLTEDGGERGFTSTRGNEFEKIKNTLSGTILKQEDIRQLEGINSDLVKALDEIKDAQEQLIQKERLVSLGHLIGGIAHNLRTPIMAVSGSVEALKCLAAEYDSSIDDKDVTGPDHHQIAGEMVEWLDKTKPMLEYMDKVITSVMGQTVNINNTDSDEWFSVGELLERINILMGYELKKNRCKIDMENLASPDIELKGQISVLVQVVNNLILNSIQAYMGQEGVIELRVVRENQNIVLSVKDHGIGIPGEIQSTLFSEMVTTKGREGTGLGLYISYSAIKAQFSGKMWFESEPGKGTTFYISIPLTEKKL